MCGFAGFLSPAIGSDEGKSILGRMARAMFLRGPDDQGVWLSSAGTVGLAHRRLSVLGVGTEGRQPMHSKSGRYVLAYNGEIYNYRELQAELEAIGGLHPSHSDTAVLLDAIDCWGIETALNKLVGMFAFALWDEQEKRLILARDRFGEKPLYFGWQGKVFLFGSTLTPLRQHPAWVGAVDSQAVAELLRYDYIPVPLSIHAGIAKLKPGTWMHMTWCDDQWQEHHHTYWSALDSALRATSSGFYGDASSAVDVLEQKMLETLRGQLLADVPLGAFMSGGVDSSTIVALMQQLSSQPVKTFTIGFDDPAYDETASAEAVAKYLGTTHATLRLTHADVIDFIPRIPLIYDEPFADASQIPAALVSHMARRDVTVALSGDGGDEIFGGYNRYLWGPRIKKRLKHVSPLIRQMLGKGMRSISPSTWNDLLSILPRTHRPRQPGEKLHKLAGLLASNSEREMYRWMTTFWPEGLPIATQRVVSDHYPFADLIWSSAYSFEEKMMLADTVSYLPDDILAKVDRAAMGASLETRAPFLDHRLFEFVWSLPRDYRIQEGSSKTLLRQLLYRYVPKQLIERPKTGFELPIGEYLRGPLRDWVESLLDPIRLRQEGYFDANMVRAAWDEHCTGKFNRQYELWSILMFQAWRST